MKPHPEALKALQRLFGYWPRQDVNETGMRAYVEAVTGANPGYPVNPHDVIEAVDRLVRGKVERRSHEWLPEPGMLAAVIRECMNERLAQEARNKPRITYQPHVVTAEEMEKRREYVKQLRGKGILKNEVST